MGRVLGGLVINHRERTSILSTREGHARLARLPAERGRTLNVSGAMFRAAATFIGGGGRRSLLLGRRRKGNGGGGHGQSTRKVRGKEVDDGPQRGVVESGESYCWRPGRPVAKRRGQRRARQEEKCGGTANLPKLEARLRGATIVEIETKPSEKECSKEEDSGQGGPA